MNGAMNGAFLEQLLDNYRVGEVVTLPGGLYEIDAPLTIASKPGLIVDARPATFRFANPTPSRWLTFSGCHGLRWMGGDFYGACTLKRVIDLCVKTNAAKTEPTSADFTTCVTFNDCDKAIVDDPRFQAFDRSIEVHKSDNFSLDRGEFIGIYDGKLSKFTADGKLDVVNKDTLRSIYNVNVRNSHFFDWQRGISRFAGGALVAGAGDDGGQSKHLNVERLQAWDSGDNGVYGSSTFYATVKACRFFNSKGGHAAKLRGDGCRITESYAIDALKGFMVEGVGKTPDAQGAAAHGQEISGNYIERATDGAIQIDQTTEGGLYPRHVRVCGNHIFDSGTEQHFTGKPIGPPIELEGGAGYLVEGNIVSGYAHECFLFIQKPSAGTYVAPNNVTGKKARVLIGSGTVDVAPFGQAF